MEEQFRALLLADASVMALSGGRISYGVANDSSGPYVVLWTISDANDHTLDGPDGLWVGRIQADCYATHYGDAKRLSRAVRAALDGKREGNFRAIFHDATRDGREGGTNDADRPFRVSLDFLTHWRP
tara:strand:+ start:1087 stop:1467 length:381 start_codon:yes stop_codon:yes gene_type:complete